MLQALLPILRSVFGVIVASESWAKPGFLCVSDSSRISPIQFLRRYSTLIVYDVYAIPALPGIFLSVHPQVRRIHISSCIMQHVTLHVQKTRHLLLRLLALPDELYLCDAFKRPFVLESTSRLRVWESGTRTLPFLYPAVSS